MCRAAAQKVLGESYMYEHDLFEDYSELLLQFGYVTLFSAAFPLAPLCALVNNVIEIRLDAVKLCFTCQRPQCLNTEDMGAWFSILNLVTIIMVVTNLLMAFL